MNDVVARVLVGISKTGEVATVIKGNMAISYHTRCAMVVLEPDDGGCVC